MGAHTLMEMASYLIIEGEVSDVDFTGTAEFSGWRPEDIAGVSDHRFALHVASGEVVGARQRRVCVGQVFTADILTGLFTTPPLVLLSLTRMHTHAHTCSHTHSQTLSDTHARSHTPTHVQIHALTYTNDYTLLHTRIHTYVHILTRVYTH